MNNPIPPEPQFETEYRVVQVYDIGGSDPNIRYLLTQGWKLQGSPAVTTAGKYDTLVAVQALVREVPNPRWRPPEPELTGNPWGPQ